jgi:iron complex outermembrane receptor protein
MLKPSLGILAWALGHGVAFAQVEPPPESALVNGGEIVVTAQRRSQALQDVPIAVTAFSAEMLERGVVADITDLQASVPSLNITTNNRPSTSTSFRLRGVGTSGLDTGLEGAVGFFVDGVYRSRSGTALGDFVDVERIEVLRGPQGTLFGKNTSAGAITVATRRPVHDFEGFGEVGFGNYNARRASGAINLPLIEDRLALRLSGAYFEREGFIEDVARNDGYNDRDRWAATAKLLFSPSGALDILLTADYAEANESCCQSVRLSNAPGSPIVPLLSGLATARGATYFATPIPNSYVTSINGEPIADFKDYGLSLQVDWDLGFAALTSISSYRDFDSFSGNDADFSGADLVYQKVGFESQNWSQELRLQGNLAGPAAGLDWLLGVYYADERIASFERPNIGGDLQAYFTALLRSATLGALYPEQQSAFGNNAEQSVESWAVFTHNILNLTDKLALTLGARYTSDDKQGFSNTFWNHPAGQFPFSGLGLPFSAHYSYVADFSDEAVTWTAILDYDWTDELMTYISAGSGYKSGGIVMNREAGGLVYSRNAACSASAAVALPAGGGLPTIFRCDPRDPRFDSETVTAFEAGLRSRWFNGALTINFTAFHAEYEDLQLNVFDGLVLRIQNAGSATTEGAELETQWRTPLEGLTLGAAVSYTDASYGGEVGIIQQGQPAVGGLPLENAPEWAGALSGNYERDVFGADTFFVRGEYLFNSDQEASTRISSTGGRLYIPSYELFNATIGLARANGLEIAAYCRNCLDERYANFLFDSVAQSGSKDQFVGNPLEYGIRIRQAF